VSLSMTRPSQFLRLIILTKDFSNFFERPPCFCNPKVGLSLPFVPETRTAAAATAERAGGASVADERLGTCGRCAEARVWRVVEVESRHFFRELRRQSKATSCGLLGTSRQATPRLVVAQPYQEAARYDEHRGCSALGAAPCGAAHQRSNYPIISGTGAYSHGAGLAKAAVLLRFMRACRHANQVRPPNSGRAYTASHTSVKV
jgi:hypothetical protein